MATPLWKQINWIDVLAAILLIRGIYVGLNKGLAEEFLKTLGLIVAAVLAIHNYPKLGQFISNHSFLSITVSDIISFIVLVLAVVAIFKLLWIVTKRVVKIQFRVEIEKTGGIILGMAHSLIASSLILVILVLPSLQYVNDSISQRSLSGPYLLRVVPAIYSFSINKLYPSEELNKGILEKIKGVATKKEVK